MEPAEAGSGPEGPEGVITSQRDGAGSGLAPFSPAGYPPSFSPSLSREVAAIVEAAQQVHLLPHLPEP